MRDAIATANRCVRSRLIAATIIQRSIFNSIHESGVGGSSCRSAIPGAKSMSKTTYQTSIPRLKNFSVAATYIPRVQSPNVCGSVLRPTRSDWFVRLTFWISSPRWSRMTIRRNFTVVYLPFDLPSVRYLSPFRFHLSASVCVCVCTRTRPYPPFAANR